MASVKAPCYAHQMAPSISQKSNILTLHKSCEYFCIIGEFQCACIKWHVCEMYVMVKLADREQPPYNACLYVSICFLKEDHYTLSASKQ